MRSVTTNQRRKVKKRLTKGLGCKRGTENLNPCLGHHCGREFGFPMVHCTRSSCYAKWGKLKQLNLIKIDEDGKYVAIVRESTNLARLQKSNACPENRATPRERETKRENVRV